MSDNEGIVFVERRVTGERTARAFAQKAGQADLFEILPQEMDDASREIEFCHRYLTNDLKKMVNISTYGVVSAGGSMDDAAERLLPYYREWQKYVHPQNRHVIQTVIFEACDLDQAARKHRFSRPSDVAWCLLDGLNEYCMLRGWGNVLDHYKFNPPSYIYVIGADSPPYKIGYSKDPKRRLRDLQIGSPVELKLHYVKEFMGNKAKAVENKLHKTYEDKKTKGEWFNVTPKEIQRTVELMGEKA